jgi:hypothetical protein
LAESGEPCHQDEGTVATRDRVRDRVQLGQRDKQLLDGPLGTAVFDPARVLADPVVLHGLAEDLAEARIGLGGYRRAAIREQSGIPTPNDLRSQIAEGDLTESRDALGDRRQDVEAQLGGVDLPSSGREPYP